MTKAIYPSRDTVPLVYTFSVSLFDLHFQLRLTVSMHLLETVCINNLTLQYKSFKRQFISIEKILFNKFFIFCLIWLLWHYDGSNSIGKSTYIVNELIMYKKICYPSICYNIRYHEKTTQYFKSLECRTIIETTQVTFNENTNNLFVYIFSLGNKFWITQKSKLDLFYFFIVKFYPLMLQ